MSMSHSCLPPLGLTVAVKVAELPVFSDNDVLLSFTPATFSDTTFLKAAVFFKVPFTESETRTNVNSILVPFACALASFNPFASYAEPSLQRI